MFKLHSKIISILICCSIAWPYNYAAAGTSLFKTTSHAQRHLPNSLLKKDIDILKDPSIISIPESLGTILDYYKGNGGSLVIHIQDRHIDPVAQKNISAIIHELTERYKVNIMMLEGAACELDTYFYDRFEDSDIKRKVLELFVDNAIFTGAEYYKILHKEKYLYAKGAETKDLYIKHLSAYNNTIISQQDIGKFLKTIILCLNTLKHAFFSRDLTRIDSASNAYAEGIIKLPEYIKTLASSALKAKIDMTDYPNLVGFAELIKKEAGIDFKKAESQREDIIKKLSHSLPRVELTALLRKSADFNKGLISQEEFYDYLLCIIESNNFKANEYDELTKYKEYLNFSKTINHIRVFDEADDIEHELLLRLAETPFQKKLISYSKSARLLDALYALKLTPRQLGQLERNNDSSNIGDIRKFLVSAYNDYGFNLPQSITAFNIDNRSMQSYREYYAIALKRDTALIENTLDKMAALNNDKALLIAGGFHTKGITNTLKQKGISYVVICPNACLKNYDSVYKDRMAGKLPDLSQLETAFTNMLVTPLQTGDTTFKTSAGGNMTEAVKQAFAYLINKFSFKQGTKPAHILEGPRKKTPPDISEMLKIPEESGNARKYESGINWLYNATEHNELIDIDIDNIGYAIRYIESYVKNIDSIYGNSSPNTDTVFKAASALKFIAENYPEHISSAIPLFQSILWHTALDLFTYDTAVDALTNIIMPEAQTQASDRIEGIEQEAIEALEAIIVSPDVNTYVYERVLSALNGIIIYKPSFSQRAMKALESALIDISLSAHYEKVMNAIIYIIENEAHSHLITNSTLQAFESILKNTNIIQYHKSAVSALEYIISLKPSLVSSETIQTLHNALLNSTALDTHSKFTAIFMLCDIAQKNSTHARIAIEALETILNMPGPYDETHSYAAFALKEISRKSPEFKDTALSALRKAESKPELFAYTLQCLKLDSADVSRDNIGALTSLAGLCVKNNISPDMLNSLYDFMAADNNHTAQLERALLLSQILAMKNASAELFNYIINFIEKDTPRDARLSIVRNIRKSIEYSAMTEDDTVTDWKIFLEKYIRIFDFTAIRELVLLHRALESEMPIESIELAKNSGITSTGQSGIRQLQRVVSGITEQIITNRDIDEQTLRNPVIKALTISATRFSAGESSHGLTVGIDIAEFVRNSHENPAPALPYHLVRTGILHVEKAGQNTFTKNENATLGRYAGLIERAKIICEKGMQKNDMDSIRLQAMDMITNEINLLSDKLQSADSELARNNISDKIGRLLKADKALAESNSINETISALLDNMGPDIPKKMPDMENILIVLMLINTFISKPDIVKAIKNKDIIDSIEYLRDEALNMKGITQPRREHLKKIFRIEISKNTRERLKQKVQGAPIFAFLDNKVLGNMAGDLGANVCYVMQDNIMHHHSMKGAIILYSDTGGEKEFIGSVLLLENTINNERVWILRAINPSEDFLNEYSADSFISELINYLKPMAEAEGVKYIASPEEANVTSNRPAITKAIENYKGKKMYLDKKEDFNGGLYEFTSVRALSYPEDDSSQKEEHARSAILQYFIKTGDELQNIIDRLPDNYNRQRVEELIKRINELINSAPYMAYETLKENQNWLTGQVQLSSSEQKTSAGGRKNDRRIAQAIDIWAVECLKLLESSSVQDFENSRYGTLKDEYAILIGASTLAERPSVAELFSSILSFMIYKGSSVMKEDDRQFKIGIAVTPENKKSTIELLKKLGLEGLMDKESIKIIDADKADEFINVDHVKLPAAIIPGNEIKNPDNIINNRLLKNKRLSMKHLVFNISQAMPEGGYNINNSSYAIEALLLKALEKLKDHKKIQQEMQGLTITEIIKLLSLELPPIDSDNFIKAAEALHRMALELASQA
jgi:hypothetical protein